MGKRSVTAGLVTCLAVLAACADAAEEAPAPPPSAAPAAPAPAPAAPVADLPVPAGATAEMVAQGQQIFVGPGICFTCHGQQGQGTPLGPNLTDDEWLWIEGPEQDLVAKLADQIRTGTPQPQEYPAPMPPMGGASLNDEQIQAVASYVAALNQ